MPGSFQTSSSGGIPHTMGIPGPSGFLDGNSPYYMYPYSISGVTRDAGGSPLPNCVVLLVRTADNSIAGVAVSDSGGNYSFPASNALQHYIVAYLDGAPDVSGTTVNTLVGA